MNRHAPLLSADPLVAAQPWWKGATIYQIYPRSFADSNDDGVGDLAGITARLDYVAALGVDAIWVSPFFTSPMNDFGYDISDYCDVDPIFGTLADFDALVERAHALGLKVIIDQVYAHTSDAHAWFSQSRQSRTGPKADWYVWANAKRDGTPPNNWQSVFGGPGWTWDARRRQYYMHNFLSSQPQLNVHNPAVQDALLGVARFWLERGVDGFRLDALNFAMHDTDLRDNPPAEVEDNACTRPFDFQQRLYNQSHPGIVGFVERIRALTDEYRAAFTLAEVGGSDALREMHEFTAGDARLNSAYGFDFLYAQHLTPVAVAAALAKWPADGITGWPSWAFENHDAPRALSRWCAADQRDAFARLKIMLLACLRGNAILYQGEELGLTQVEIAFDQLRDPEAIANWPLTLSRDGARTPMPWIAQGEYGGFSNARPWLPLGEQNLARAVDRQEASPDSLLSLTRAAIALRREDPALRLGTAEVLVADDARLVLRRRLAGRTVLCLFNLSDRAVAWPEGVPASGRSLLAVNHADVGTLPPFAALIVET